ncbi:MAG: hypothetical protein ACK4IS_09930 [Erythrobacter sp.]
MTRPDRRQAEDPRARNRFILMNVSRFAGVAMVMLGMAIIQRVIDLPSSLGVVLAVIGMFDFFVVPLLLAKAWKRQEAAGKETSRR